ncbi:MAG: class I SAM-dependent methyltransferase [bacterium]
MEIISSEAEITNQNEFRILPPESHPNYHLWANYSKFARNRGELVADILQSFSPIANMQILDLGCGDGGTTLALVERGGKVTAIDFNPKKVQMLKQKALTINSNLVVLQGDAQQLYLKNNSFDWVVLQDILEHLPNPELAVKEVTRVLKQDGSVYLSTPNRWSPLNFISDPHWNLPLVSVLPRKTVVFFVTRLFYRENHVRRDFAALLSLFKINRLFERENIKLQFVNQKIAAQLFIHPRAVVNSNLHLNVVKWLQTLKLEKLVTGMVNDKFGFFNYFINPTWYLIGKKINNISKL